MSHKIKYKDNSLHCEFGQPVVCTVVFRLRGCLLWKQSYQYYIDGKGITNPSQKKAQLLHLEGMEDIYEDLPVTGPTEC